MREIRSIAFLIPHPDDFMEGLRSALGLALENFLVDIYVFRPVHDPDSYTVENIAWLKDLEVEVYTTDCGDARNYGFLFRTPEEIGIRLKEMDLVIPFGRTP